MASAQSTRWNRFVECLGQILSHPAASLIRPAMHLVAYYPLLLAFPIVLLAFIWGYLMADYDVVHLFWHDDPMSGLLSGVGVALVFGQVILSTYLLDRNRYIRALALYRDWPGGRHFQPRHPLKRSREWGYWVTWLVLLVLAGAPAVTNPGWFTLHGIDKGQGWDIRNLMNAELPAGAVESDTAMVEYVKAREGKFRRAMARAQYWFPIGLIFTAVSVGLARQISLHVVPAGAPRTSPVTPWGTRRRILFLRMFRGPVYFGWVLVTFFGVLYVALLLAHFVSDEAIYCPTYPATFSVLLLVGFLAGLAWRFTSLAGRRIWLYPLVLALPLFLFLIPNAQTRYQLPHMTNGADPRGRSYYDRELTRERPQLEDYAKLKSETGLLDDQAVLAAWDRRMKDTFGPDPQPVIVVAVSGGASAAALYTANVLYTLEELFPGFSDRVRVISGASGGMLGAAYFVTQLRDGGVIYQNRRSREYRQYYEAQQRLNTINRRGSEWEAALKARNDARAAYGSLALQRREAFLQGLEQDFLSPLIQKWVHKDMPLYYLPTPTTNDRGAALEAAWDHHLKQNPLEKSKDAALATRFASLRDEEKTGAIPSLIFSPMMIEDGRQLLISNLNLNYMVETHPWSVEAKPPPPSEETLLSVTAMEFFRLFPNARDFRLGTAVRMSASFPYFSPSAELPTNPIRHIVDAGYYDKYGTTVATKWIANNSSKLATGVREPKPEGVHPIILLRIRCFAWEAEKRAFVTKREKDALADTPSGEIARTHQGLFTLTGPVLGLFSSWQANMLYRGDERVAALDALVKAQKGEFQYPIVESAVDPSLNWVLTPDTILRLHTDAWIQVRTAGQYADATKYPSSTPPKYLPKVVEDKIAERAADARKPLPSLPFSKGIQAGMVGPAPVSPDKTKELVQLAPSYESASKETKQAIDSVTKLATQLVNLPLAAPGPP